MQYPDATKLPEILDKAQKVLIIQADNPDADSLGSALALESILGDMGKATYMYCSVDMPTYLRYMSGWDRVAKDLPSSFDVSIIVDASTLTLFDKFQDANVQGVLKSKPCIVLDHHAITDNPLPFASLVINDGTRASTGELIYVVGKDLGWTISPESGEYIMSSILGDTQGLSNDLASPLTYRIMAELIEAGVNRPLLEEQRREYGKMPQVIFKYKAELIRRTEFFADDRIAIVTVPQAEINEFSPLYNPAPLIQNDALQTKGVQVAIVLKGYDSGRVTGAIRCNAGFTIAGDLATHFGGGGHQYASGFKVENGRTLADIKAACVQKATELLDTLEYKK
jgi:phosphoesterase RecJ-like protein